MQYLRKLCSERDPCMYVLWVLALGERLSHFTGRKKDHDTPLVDREIMTLHW